MGDRALIHFHDGDEISPCIYLHWGGSIVEKLLQETRKKMEGREGDVQYTWARCIGIADDEVPGNLSLGVWNAPSDKYREAREEMIRMEPCSFDREQMHYPYSHGDAGVFLVNCKTWEVEYFGGYGLAGEAKNYTGEPRKVMLRTPGSEHATA